MACEDGELKVYEERNIFPLIQKTRNHIFVNLYQTN